MFKLEVVLNKDNVKFSLGDINLITGDKVNCNDMTRKLIRGLRHNHHIKDIHILYLNDNLKVLEKVYESKAESYIIVTKAFIKKRFTQEDSDLVKKFFYFILSKNSQAFVNVPTDMVYVDFMNAVISMDIDLEKFKIISA